MSKYETLTNTSPYTRSNIFGEDPRPQSQSGFNNVASGITQTLTINLFNRSFPDGIEELKLFATFGGAPKKIVGAGVKNIQGGIKGTRQFVDVRIGDVIAVKIEDRVKVYESIIPSSNQIRFQCSLDYPPHGHVDKFLDAGEYEQFMRGYREALPQAMAKTMYELIRFMFISSQFGACLPTREYDKLLLKTLIETEPLPDAATSIRPFENQPPSNSPLMQYMIHHRDHFKALADEFNRKISNLNVYDVQDIIYTQGGAAFDPYKPGKVGRGGEMNAMKKLAKCLKPREEPLIQEIPRVGVEDGQDLINRRWRMSREKSLKALEIVMAKIGSEMERPNTYGGQGNCGNIYYSQEKNGNSSEVPSVLYKRNAGSKIMDRPMAERPMFEIVCKKPNKVLIMSRSDYEDFTSGIYSGGFGSETIGRIDFSNVTKGYSEIIPVDGIVGGHFIVMDKRMFALIPHLEATGTDTIAQRLVSVSTMHKGLIYGMFDQFAAARVQLVGYTASPIDMTRTFFSEKDVVLFSGNYGSSDAMRIDV